MRKRNFKVVGLTVGAVLALGGCSDDETNTFPGGQIIAGFQVLTSDPYYNDEFVPLTKEIRVTLTAPVDEASVEGAVRVQETTGGASIKDITAEGTLSLANNGASIVFAPFEQYVIDSKYEMILSSGLRSTTGENLSSQTIVLFYTGARGGSGLITKEGPPKVVDNEIIQSPGAGLCLGFLVKFSEDLASPPQASAKISGGFGLLPGGGSFMEAFPAYGTGLQSWILTFAGSYGCDCGLFSGDVKIDLKVSSAFDFQGEQMKDDWEKRFAGYQFAPMPGCY